MKRVEASRKGDWQGSRREFLRTAGVAALGAGAGIVAGAESHGSDSAETHVGLLYDSLSEAQRSAVAFDWDHRDPRRGVLRTYVANNWQITEPTVDSDFYTADQRALIRAIYERIYHPDWVARIDRQLADDAGGWGRAQSLAIFGQPGSGRFELVMTGRHLTVRCDGDWTEGVAFGGPIFYGHAASSFREPADHPGNVFWPQALQANRVFQMLDGRQRELALVSRSPRESAVDFDSEGRFPGIPVSELSPDQKDEVAKTLDLLLAPYRASDGREARAHLESQGGLDACSLAFYADRDIGGDGVWDNWRLEGPAFVWYFRGAPHVHVWVNVSDDPGRALNSSI